MYEVTPLSLIQIFLFQGPRGPLGSPGPHGKPGRRVGVTQSDLRTRETLHCDTHTVVVHIRFKACIAYLEGYC